MNLSGAGNDLSNEYEQYQLYSGWNHYGPEYNNGLNNLKELSLL